MTNKWEYIFYIIYIFIYAYVYAAALAQIRLTISTFSVIQVHPIFTALNHKL